ncbi:hypothetical protein NDU88_004645 [Pleurodeles waltl]|uniref:Uncharacterized protein n=1 Tax=Pleurodeles waltl TaxID=8319 RepID=A0AAV7V1Q1_PLEWA|nr:hypothetical protein NDU88_004645 [Pleurodeles waltl]
MITLPWCPLELVVTPPHTGRALFPQTTGYLVQQARRRKGCSAERWERLEALRTEDGDRVTPRDGRRQAWIYF